MFTTYNDDHDEDLDDHDEGDLDDQDEGDLDHQDDHYIFDNLEVNSRPPTQYLEESQHVLFAGEKVDVNTFFMANSIRVTPCEELEVCFLEDIASGVAPAKHFVVAGKIKVIIGQKALGLKFYFYLTRSTWERSERLVVS